MFPFFRGWAEKFSSTRLQNKAHLLQAGCWDALSISRMPCSLAYGPSMPAAMGYIPLHCEPHWLPFCLNYLKQFFHGITLPDSSTLLCYFHKLMWLRGTHPDPAQPPFVLHAQQPFTAGISWASGWALGGHLGRTLQNSPGRVLSHASPQITHSHSITKSRQKVHHTIHSSEKLQASAKLNPKLIQQSKI
jgi:hypothetical protein